MMMVVLQIVKYLLMDKVCASAVGVKEYVLLTCSLVGILDGQHVTHTAQSFISSLLITILCLLLSSWIWIGLDLLSGTGVVAALRIVVQPNHPFPDMWTSINILNDACQIFVDGLSVCVSK